MESLYEILNMYGIRINKFTQITPKVYRIEDENNIYALKKTELNQNNVSNWTQVYHEANNYDLRNILPVYLTENESLYTMNNGQIYYLSPWVSEQGEKNVESLYQAIGTIHSLTKYRQIVNTEKLLHEFQTYRSFCEQSEKTLLIYIEQFESQHYISPLELQVCTHFRDVELSIRLLLKRIEKFLKELQENDEWSFSLCHGQLKYEHLLTTLDNTFLINWENSSYNYPIFDLIYFFKQESIKYHSPKDNIVKSFSIYMDYNELTQKEINLMLIYLLDPKTYMIQIEQYINGKNSSMIELTRLLQKQYRIIRFAIELSKYIESEYDYKNLAEGNDG